MQHAVLQDKENSGVPATPRKNRLSPKKPVRRVPLGGKDHNQSSAVVALKPAHRHTKLKAAFPPVHLKKKLAVLHDFDDSAATTTTSTGEDFEIETRPLAQPELPYIPLNYTPFTDEDLANLSHTPLKSLLHTTPMDDDGKQHEQFSDSEFPLDFESDEEMSKRDNEVVEPRFMQPTLGSSLKRNKVEVFNDGLTQSDLQRLIDEQ